MILAAVRRPRDTLADYTLPFLRRVRKQADVPCLAGFGVSTPEQAQEMAEACDGVIVGSALLRVLEACAEPREMEERARRFAASFRKALDEARAAVAPCS